MEKMQTHLTNKNKIPHVKFRKLLEFDMCRSIFKVLNLFRMLQKTLMVII